MQHFFHFAREKHRLPLFFYDNRQNLIFSLLFAASLGAESPALVEGRFAVGFEGSHP